MLKNIENQSSPLTPGNKRNADAMLQQFVGSPLISPSTETVVSDAQSDTENYTQKRPRVNGEGQVVGTPADKISPSRVIHVRNLPQDTSESEVMFLASVHGQVTNLILMRNKRQAFVEMHDVKQSMAFLRHHQNQMCPALIRGQPVQLQYSATYTELKPGQRSHSSGMKPTPVLHINVDNHVYPITLQMFHQIFSKYGYVEKIITFTKNNQFQSLVQMEDVNIAQTAKQALDGKNVFQDCCVLRIDFSKMISINVKYNNDKSFDYTKPDLPSGDETMPGVAVSAHSATNLQLGAAAQSHMGQMFNPIRPMNMLPYAPAVTPNPMLNSMSTLAGLGGYRFLPGVNPAMLSGFSIHSQPPLNAQQLPPSSTAAAGAALAPQRPMQLTPPRLPMSQLSVQDQQISPSQLQQLQQQQLMLTQLRAAQLQGLDPNQLRLQQTLAANQLAANQFAANQFAANQAKLQPFQPSSQLQAQQFMLNQPSALPMTEAQPVVSQYPGLTPGLTHGQLSEHQLLTCRLPNPQQLPTNQLLQQCQVTTAAAATGLPAMMSSAAAPPVNSDAVNATSPPPLNNTSPIVLVSNLNAKRISPDALFTLFGVYGDVIRVKILYHKLDNAMIQYADHSNAVAACKYLDRVVFWDSEIRVALSKHYNIQMPPGDTRMEGSKLTKDYSRSDQHRYKKYGSRNIPNICPTSNTLHLSNIPGEISEESSLVELFSKYGSVTGFRFFAKDKRMALIQFSTVQEAVEALIGLHNIPLNKTHNLRVSFSKSSLQ